MPVPAARTGAGTEIDDPAPPLTHAAHRDARDDLACDAIGPAGCAGDGLVARQGQELERIAAGLAEIIVNRHGLYLVLWPAPAGNAVSITSE